MLGGLRVSLLCKTYRCPGRSRAPVLGGPLLAALFLLGAEADGSVVVPSSTAG